MESKLECTGRCCTQCDHPEKDHVAHWADGRLIPGNLCYYEENQGHCEDLCPCTGFNTVPANSTYLDTLVGKAGV